jgi:hypothetical protein
MAHLAFKKSNHSLTQKFDRTILEEVATPFNLIKIRYLTYSPLLICRGVGAEKYQYWYDDGARFVLDQCT